MYWECQRCHEQGGPENDYHPYVLYPATGHGAYYYDADKSGASADSSIKWEAYSCENKCGDYYLKKVTITSLDANGARVPNVNVRIVDSAGKTVVNDKTNGNGELVIEGSSYSNSLHPGRYDIYLEYVRDGSNYNTHGTVNFADGKVTGSFGKLTPYGGNASGSIGGKPTGEFRCSMCDLNDSMKNKPVIGWFISIIHAFVHAISRIGRR
ncbi:MAG: carboxypeptidase regulatory-like domain-containing protein [Clostridia bacterium]|nr:carboxypeptidase regulatory-like domain-containing protein [Clostridia bacterium]